MKTMPDLQPGDRVRIARDCAGWIPAAYTGTEATVLRTNAGGVTLKPDRFFICWPTRYVPWDMAYCLERLPATVPCRACGEPVPAPLVDTWGAFCIGCQIPETPP